MMPFYNPITVHNKSITVINSLFVHRLGIVKALLPLSMKAFSQALEHKHFYVCK
uniref:Uncharacterized protein n=1 Tax=Anguilla anguilla TaxID=7936 RepID=A0A0E9UPA6_ANGAN